jgi:uncharacterized repeat protein (TIGR01451 family)
MKYNITSKSNYLVAIMLAILVVLTLGNLPLEAQAQAINSQQNSFSSSSSVLITDELRQEIQKFGEIPIMIGLDVAAYDTWIAGESAQAQLDESQLTTVVAEITTVADGLLMRLEGQRISQIKRYDFFPLLAMIADEEALEALAADRSVTQISLDLPVPPLMDDTIPLIGANNNHFLNYTGSGWSIAILDTGVDKNHPALFGKVISEACYSSNVPSHGASSLCPGGATSSTATNSGLNCALGISGCDHGTHVAGIAARVAPSAWLIPIQVFSRFTDGSGNTYCMDSNRTSPCTLSYTSDQVAALNRVWGLHVGNPNISVASVNMSLGSGRHTGTCDHLSEYNNLRIAINQLRDQNVSTVIAAGNSSYRDAMAAPACLTPAISVAASTKTDQIASFTNISPLTTLIAPGVSILAPVTTSQNPNLQTRNGTSMAAPHVAGAIATLKEAQPNATVPQIITALTNSGPNVTDQRSGGFVTKRRLNTWNTLCALISCDGDDFRTISANQTLNGAISPAMDVDHYYYFGTAGQRLTLRMNRTSGSHDPYLELLSPSGFRVAFNDNGGGGVNALINGYLLPQNGLYKIRARSVNNSTGGYQITTSTEAEPLNPVPQISHLSPGWVYGSFFGSDFWVAIYGSNFMPESQVRINGQLRAKYYSSPSLIYIRVLGSDIYWPWPRNAFITVVNPTPGGGTSNSRAFPIYDPFLGESNLLFPEPGSSVTVGEKQTFSVEWIAPDDTGTWRDMQNMDVRLRDENGETAAWIRVVEQPGTDSYYRLMNAAGEVIDEGDPGEARDLVIPEVVTLHLEESTFSGSGLIAVMSPTVTFGPGAVGIYNIEFRVDSKSGEDDEPNVQDGDNLGTFVILPAECPVGVDNVTLSGPEQGYTDETYMFTTTVGPGNATPPLIYRWSPEPVSGQGTDTASYVWESSGEHIIFVSVENCGSFMSDLASVLIASGDDPDLEITKYGPVVAVPGEPFDYVLTITNHGAQAATDLLVSDVLPEGATYEAGGSFDGSVVTWELEELAGFGQFSQFNVTISAEDDLLNEYYWVDAQSGQLSYGEPVETRMVDSVADLTPLTGADLSDPESRVNIMVPGGAVFADTLLAYQTLYEPTYPLSPLQSFAGFAFDLLAVQENQILPDFNMGEMITMAFDFGEMLPMSVKWNQLRLLAWDGEQWSSSGITCTPDVEQSMLECDLLSAAMTEYAVFEVSNQIFLPITTRGAQPGLPNAKITGIEIDGQYYAVAFATYFFDPSLEGQHVHFFFDTVPEEEAGMPGNGPWYVYAGESPFMGYGPGDRPGEATQLCVLVANPDHSIIAGSGNCYPLP